MSEPYIPYAPPENNMLTVKYELTRIEHQLAFVRSPLTGPALDKCIDDAKSKNVCLKEIGFSEQRIKSLRELGIYYNGPNESYMQPVKDYQIRYFGPTRKIACDTINDNSGSSIPTPAPKDLMQPV